MEPVMSIRLEDLEPSVLAKAAADWGEQCPTSPLPGYFHDLPEEWLAMHGRFCDRASQGSVRVLFIGDSITQGWGSEGLEAWNEHFEALPSANFGIGGDRTQQILWRIQKGTLEGIDPEVVVLLIGVNNLWSMSHSAAEVAQGIKEVVSLLQEKLPRTKILLQGILPTGEEASNPLRPLIQDINTIVSQLHDGDKVYFHDFGSLFLMEDGRISADVMPDFCHLSPAAYQMWAKALKGPLSALLNPEGA
jgi:lysophospholipase L1-like esterase